MCTGHKKAEERGRDKKNVHFLQRVPSTEEVRERERRGKRERKEDKVKEREGVRREKGAEESCTDLFWTPNLGNSSIVVVREDVMGLWHHVGIRTETVHTHAHTHTHTHTHAHTHTHTRTRLHISLSSSIAMLIWRHDIAFRGQPGNVQ